MQPVYIDDDGERAYFDYLAGAFLILRKRFTAHYIFPWHLPSRENCQSELAKALIDFTEENPHILEKERINGHIV